MAADTPISRPPPSSCTLRLKRVCQATHYFVSVARYTAVNGISRYADDGTVYRRIGKYLGTPTSTT